MHLTISLPIKAIKASITKHPVRKTKTKNNNIHRGIVIGAAELRQRSSLKIKRADVDPESHKRGNDGNF
jgi:hypothetical protein